MILLTPTEIGDALDLEQEGIYPCSNGSIHYTLKVDNLLQAQLKKVVDKWGETPHLLIRDNVGGWGIDLQAVNDFWQALLKEVE